MANPRNFRKLVENASTEFKQLKNAAGRDRTLVQSWIRQFPDVETRKTYAREAGRFLRHVNKPLRELELEDVRRFCLSIANHAPATVRRIGSIVRSLLAFVGVDPDVAKALPFRELVVDVSAHHLDVPSENDVQRWIRAAAPGRDRMTCRLIYGAGLTSDEVAGLLWRDVRADAGGSLSVFGGNAARVVALAPSLFADLVRYRNGAAAETAVIGLSPRQIRRIVKVAAGRAGLPSASATTFRLAHAAHALENGCPPASVRKTVGAGAMRRAIARSDSARERSSSSYVRA